MKSRIYGWIRRRQDRLKRNTDRRFEGVWMGPPPKLLEAKELLAGDVLFCGEAQRGKVNELIQNTTDGVYTHCAIYAGEERVIEAVETGVREISLEQLLTNRSYVAVTRSPSINPISKIVGFARSCVEHRRKYNFLAL